MSYKQVDDGLAIGVQIDKEGYKKDLRDIERETTKAAKDIQTSANGATVAYDQMSAAMNRAVAVADRYRKLEASRAANTNARKGIAALAQQEAILAANMGKTLNVAGLLKNAFSMLIRVINPAGLAITAIGTAVGFFMGKAADSTSITDKYASTISGLGGTAEQAARGINALRREIAAMSQEEATYALDKTEEKIRSLTAELDKQKKRDFSNWANYDHSFKGPKILDNGFNKAIDDLAKDQIKFEDFSKAIFDFRNKNPKLVSDKQLESVISLGKELASGKIAREDYIRRMQGLPIVFEEIPRVAGVAKKEMESLNGYIVRFRLDLEKLGGMNNFEVGLRSALGRLAKDLENVKGATSAVKESLARELTEAHGAAFFNDIKKGLSDVSAGNKALSEMTDKVSQVANALKVLGPDSKAAADFIKEMNEAGMESAVTVADQLELIESQAAALKELNPELAAYIEKLKELAKQRTKDGDKNKDKDKDKDKKKDEPKTFKDGWKEAADSFVDDWTNAAFLGEKAFEGMLSNIQDFGSTVIDAIFNDGEIRAEEFFQNISKMILQMMMNQAIAGFLKSFGFGTAHTGGIIGVPDTNQRRHVSPLVFAGAPKYHSGGIVGLSSGEVPIIAKAGEGVFTAAQMRALAPVGAQGNTTVQIIDQRSSKSEPVQVQETKSADGMKQIRVLIRDEVSNDIGRRGSVYKAIGSAFDVSPARTGY